MEYRAEQARERAQRNKKAGKKQGFKVEVYKPSQNDKTKVRKLAEEHDLSPEQELVTQAIVSILSPAPVEVLPPLDDPWDMVCVHIVDSRDRHAENVRGFWQDKFQLALPQAPELVDIGGSTLVESATAPAKGKGKRAPKTTRVVSKNQEVFVPPAVVDLDPTADLVKYVKTQARKENTIARIKDKISGEFADSYGIYPEPGTEIKKANRKVRDTLAAQKRKVTKPADAQKGDYKKLQGSNSAFFKALPKADQAYLRAQGYNNVGWDKVLKSAKLIEQFKLG
jgi:hypothetical protein